MAKKTKPTAANLCEFLESDNLYLYVDWKHVRAGWENSASKEDVDKIVSELKESIKAQVKDNNLDPIDLCLNDQTVRIGFEGSQRTLEECRSLLEEKAALKWFDNLPFKEAISYIKVSLNALGDYLASR